MMYDVGEGCDFYYGHDHLYSVVVIYDDDYDVYERMEYDAYGEVTRLDPDFTAWSREEKGNPYYFTGRRRDTYDEDNYNIYYYRARYYDAETGRFLSRDPLGYADGMNMFEYVGGGPTIGVDPSGMKLITWPKIRKSNCTKGDTKTKGPIPVGLVIYSAVEGVTVSQTVTYTGTLGIELPFKAAKVKIGVSVSASHTVVVTGCGAARMELNFNCKCKKKAHTVLVLWPPMWISWPSLPTSSKLTYTNYEWSCKLAAIGAGDAPMPVGVVCVQCD